MLGYRVHVHQMLLDKYMNTCNQQGGQLRTYQFSSVAQLCPALATTWIVAHQASLSITSSQSLLQLMSIELVMPSSQLILCHALLLPPSIYSSIRVFSNSRFFASAGQSIEASASSSVLPIQDLYPLGWTGWISFQSKGLSRAFSNTTVQKHQFFSAQFSL